ncbi:uncharacterized aarF domain-containing protein kinase 2-like isoform X2 [Hylaeus anthracinus]|uniref:uncharacterized aarF domain-containing protein kinase 2-like isoform X2 n=1 Tax=Hylaeus anthracinus TaxID=313031 RepID=UPI0023B8CEBE|nr:uncharacterized aarF domain-containing protein kinase 2-like isoform X2 [Hylaeus anthracinus]XP_054010593.1 uncharacterized aarF domain-containing protein kinase 2-like isoform X2 [Hylaeus anthracinus]
MRHINFEGSKRAVQAVLILSYEPNLRPYMHPTKSLIKSTQQEGFFAAVQNAILILTRIFVIGSIVTGLAIAYFVTRFTHGHVFPEILRKSIEHLGPIFVKFGQWAATRNDLFPEDICRTLSRLQRTVSPHSWSYTKHLLKSTYGSNWKNIFVKFEDKVPIGSGCCAQARFNSKHKKRFMVQHDKERGEWRIVNRKLLIEYFNLGWINTFVDRMLNDDGEMQQDNAYKRKLQPVAIKILHPGIKGQLKRDLSIMKGICKCATYIVPQLHWLSLPDCIDEFSQIMENQVDMNLEEANLLKFSKNFAGKEDVIFPHPYTNFTQREILVESFHEGTPISDYLEYDDTKLQEKLAKIGIRTILKMVFKDNFIHCDLHPGNILVDTNCEPTGRIWAWLGRFIDRDYLPSYPRLVILDCGLVVSLNARCQRNLRDVFRSVLMGRTGGGVHLGT